MRRTSMDPSFAYSVLPSEVRRSVSLRLERRLAGESAHTPSVLFDKNGFDCVLDEINDDDLKTGKLIFFK